MAIRAVLSENTPTPRSEELWVGAYGVEGDDGIGVTTAAIVAYLSEAEPGTWYPLETFENLVRSSKKGSHSVEDAVSEKGPPALEPQLAISSGSIPSQPQSAGNSSESVGDAEEWTALEIQLATAAGSIPVSIDLKLNDAVASLLHSTVDFLKSLNNERIWVRFE